MPSAERPALNWSCVTKPACAGRALAGVAAARLLGRCGSGDVFVDDRGGVAVVVAAAVLGDDAATTVAGGATLAAAAAFDAEWLRA